MPLGHILDLATELLNKLHYHSNREPQLMHILVSRNPDFEKTSISSLDGYHFVNLRQLLFACIIITNF